MASNYMSFLPLSLSHICQIEQKQQTDSAGTHIRLHTHINSVYMRNTHLVSLSCKIAVGNVVLFFSPYHWNTKWKVLNFSFTPSMQVFHTSFAANVRYKGLILIPQFHSKISMVTFFNKRCDLGFTVRKSNFATNAAKPVGVTFTAPHCNLQSTFPMLILTSTQNLTIENHANSYQHV